MNEFYTKACHLCLSLGDYDLWQWHSNKTYDIYEEICHKLLKSD